MAGKVEDMIKQCINSNKSFVLEAGAGAGKTHTLMQTIEYLQYSFAYENKFKPKILCITYTNIAKNEIRERLKDNHDIIVNTMHEFFGGYISQFQIELKKVIFEFIEEDKIKLNNEIEKAQKLIDKPRKNTNIEAKKQEVEKNEKN